MVDRFVRGLWIRVGVYMLSVVCVEMGEMLTWSLALPVKEATPD
jgi:hypothetical protein